MRPIGNSVFHDTAVVIIIADAVFIGFNSGIEANVA